MRRLSDSGEVYPNKGEKVREGIQILFTKLSLNLFVLAADSSFWHRRCVQRRSWTPSTERAQTHTDSSAAVDSRSVYSVLPPRQNTSKHATSLFNFSINSPNIDPPRWENIWATKRRIRAHTQQLSSNSVRAADESCPPVRFWSQWMCWDCSCCSINKSGSAMRADNTVKKTENLPVLLTHTKVSAHTRTQDWHGSREGKTDLKDNTNWFCFTFIICSSFKKNSGVLSFLWEQLVCSYTYHLEVDKLRLLST